MNAVTPTKGGSVETRKPTRQETVAQALKHIQRNYLSIWSEIAQLAIEFNDLRRQTGWQGQMLHPPMLRHFQPSTLEERDRALAFLRQTQDHQPEPERLQALLERVNGAITEGFNDRRVRMIIGAMIDAFPNARPHAPEVYVESLIDNLGSDEAVTAAVAMACNDIIRTATFLPSISEVLEKTKSNQRSLSIWQSGFGRAAVWSGRAEEAIAWLEATPVWDKAGQRAEFPGNDEF